MAWRSSGSKATRETLTGLGFDVSGLTDAQITDNHGWLLFPNFFMTIRAGEANLTEQERGSRSRCERLARAALEKRYGRALPDKEWESIKGDLITFVRLLRDWERGTVSVSSELPAGVSDES